MLRVFAYEKLNPVIPREPSELFPVLHVPQGFVAVGGKRRFIVKQHKDGDLIVAFGPPCHKQEYDHDHHSLMGTVRSRLNDGYDWKDVGGGFIELTFTVDPSGTECLSARMWNNTVVEPYTPVLLEQKHRFELAHQLGMFITFEWSL